MMRLLACFVLLACNSKQPTQQTAKKEPARAEANDPRTSAPTPADPAWAKDPPDVLRAKITSVNGHIVVMKRATFSNWREVLATIENIPGVANAEAFTFSELEIERTGRPPRALSLKGVDPARVGRVLAIGQHVRSGSFDALATTGAPPPIILGVGLASVLGVTVGDDVTVRPRKDAVPDADPTRPSPKETVFRVAGTFLMDFAGYNDELGFAPLAAVQAMLGTDDVVGIEMTVLDIETAEPLARTIETTLGPMYRATDWYTLNEQLFRALGHERP